MYCTKTAGRDKMELAAAATQDVLGLLKKKILLLTDNQLDELIKVVEYELSKNEH